MSERNEYAAGEFSWVDLATTDVDGAKSFYEDLLGIEVQPAPSDPEETGYGFFMKGGKMVAGIGPVHSDEEHSAWSSYIRVEDADATADKATEAGGSVFFGPADLPNDSGRVAMLRDPSQAFIGVVEQKRHPGAQVVNEAGTWNWTNLLTRDVDAAQDFYGKVFGWSAVQPQGAPDFIWSWQLDGQRWPEGIAGLMRMGTDMPAEAPDYWQVYLVVENADEAIEKTKSAGGRLVFGPQEIPSGRMATLFDPQGAAFSIIEANFPEPR